MTIHDPNGMDDKRLDQLMRSLPVTRPRADLAERIVSAAIQHPQLKRNSLFLRVLNALDGFGSGYALRPAFCSLVAVITFTFGVADGYFHPVQEEDYTTAWYEETEITGGTGDVGGA